MPTALVLNYFGQGALLLEDPEAARNPFYLLAPSWALIPLVALSTLATVIASQAVISGAFSLTRQAIQLGYIPRMYIQHTSSAEQGQIYIGAVNWTLMVGVILLVLGFESSNALASAYGVAVTGTMLITSILVSAVMLLLWKWPPILTVPILIGFLLVDGLFFAANVPKIVQGGAFPVLAAGRSPRRRWPATTDLHRQYPCAAASSCAGNGGVPHRASGCGAPCPAA